jgi:hypothetical protein
MIALHASIHDRRITLLSDTFPSHLIVDPVRVTPHAVVDFAKLHGSTGVIQDGIFELLIKVAIVQKHVRIMPPSVEVALDGPDRLDDAVQFFISREHDEGCVGLGPGRFDVHTASCEYLVMFLTDSSVLRAVSHGI